MVMNNSPTVRECTSTEYETAIGQLSHAEHTVPLSQAPYYGAWQATDGKQVVYFAAEQDGAVIAAGLAVKYDAPGGISFFYCPYGPLVSGSWTPGLLDALRSFFGPIAKRSGAAFVRLDSPGLGDLDGVYPVPNKLAATASLQSRAEWLLDISGDQEAIWMGMHKHARYNVRLAERAKAQAVFYEPSKAPLEDFTRLMDLTAKRDSFGLQTAQYYRAVLGTIPPEHGFMTTVTIDKKLAAAAIFAEYDGTVHYVFSGSSDDFRKIAPPYFMLWQTILEARRRGWNVLNFGGITEPVKGAHLSGITGFKKRFGGYEATHTNPVDLVYKPLKYTAFKLYKTLR
jgi:lipid II:glycine glycyltransferase (peptidoglycan interpeptide bridge formation enzyme)